MPQQGFVLLGPLMGKGRGGWIHPPGALCHEEHTLYG